MRDPYGVPVLVGTGIAFPILGIIAVAIRFYVRLRVRKTFVGIDDYLILAALPLVVGQDIVQILGAEYGASGRAFQPMSSEGLRYQTKKISLSIAYFNHTKTLTGSGPTFWTQAEVSIGIVAACLPPMAPLLHTFDLKHVYRIIRSKISSIGSRRGGSEHDSGKGRARGTESESDVERVDLNVVKPSSLV